MAQKAQHRASDPVAHPRSTILPLSGPELLPAPQGPLQRGLRQLLERAERQHADGADQLPWEGADRARRARDNADHPEPGRVHGPLRQGTAAPGSAFAGGARNEVEVSGFCAVAWDVVGCVLCMCFALVCRAFAGRRRSVTIKIVGDTGWYCESRFLPSQKLSYLNHWSFKTRSCNTSSSDPTFLYYLSRCIYLGFFMFVLWIQPWLPQVLKLLKHRSYLVHSASEYKIKTQWVKWIFLKESLIFDLTNVEKQL